MIALAVETGIAPTVWADEGARAITTAVKILEDKERRASGKSTSEPGEGSPYSGVTMSG